MEAGSGRSERVDEPMDDDFEIKLRKMEKQVDSEQAAVKRKRAENDEGDQDEDVAGRPVQSVELVRAFLDRQAQNKDILEVCEEPVNYADGEEIDEDMDQLGDGYVYDELTGEALSPKLVRAAKDDELSEVYRRKVWDEVDEDECLRETAAKPIPTRWIIHNKGDSKSPNIRCRLVAQHVRRKYGGDSMEGLFAAMPPFEAVKLLLVKCATSRQTGDKARKLMFIDISKAHLYAPVDKLTKAYVQLPPEKAQLGKCGRLNYWLYGMRPASHGWEEEYIRVLVKIGFKVGRASPCCFRHVERNLSLSVHGDDFVFEGNDFQLRWVAEELKRVWLVKARAVMGPEAGDDKEVSILNRVVQWREQGLTYEADPRHVEKLLRDLGMENCNPLKVPGGRQADEEADLEELGGADVRLYRGAVARCNYLATDRADISFATKELCKAMSAPRIRDLKMLKKLSRYLKGKARLVQMISFDQVMGEVIHVHVDSDWDGCRDTRKSTNGGCLSVGPHCLKTWSTNQAVLALSSGEAEYYAAIKGACVALGFQSVARDLGLEFRICLYTDSTAAKGTMSRRGLGKVRHIDVGYLWLQQKVYLKALVVKKINGKENPADLGTKYLSAEDIEKHLVRLGFAFESGRSSVVPDV